MCAFTKCGEQQSRNHCAQVLRSVKRKQRVLQEFVAGTLLCVSEADAEVSWPGSKEKSPSRRHPWGTNPEVGKIHRTEASVPVCRFDPGKGQIYFKKKKRKTIYLLTRIIPAYRGDNQEKK